MAADPSIYQQFLQPVRSVNEYASDIDRRELAQLQLQGQRGQNALLDITRQGQAQAAQQNIAKQNAIQRLLSNPAYRGADPSLVEDAMIGDPMLSADGYARRESRLKNEKLSADIGKTGAETASTTAGTVDKALARYRNALDFIDTKQGAVRWLQAQFADPAVAPHMAAFGSPEQAAARIPDDPQGFEQWRQRAAMGMEKFVADQTTKRGHDMTRATSLETTGMNNRTSLATNAATNATTREGQRLTNDRAIDANNVNKDAARTQIVNDPNQGIMLVDKGTGVARPAVDRAGAPVPSENAAAATKQWSQLGSGIEQARALIPNATNSGFGSMLDRGANFVGQSTAGAEAATQLKTLAGWMTANVPRMQGPQSDRDVMLYQQMAARVGDDTVPAAQRLAALNTLDEIRSRYTGQKPAANPAPKDAKPAAANSPFNDAEKERRYQEWKAKQK